MDCCGSNSKKPKEKVTEKQGGNAADSSGINILLWGVIIVIVVGLLVWLIK